MRLGRLLLFGLLGLVLLAALALFSVDMIVDWAVERSATRALGVRTRVGAARVGLLRGGLALQGVRVANPEGFSGDFLRLRDARLELDLRSLRAPTVRAPSLELETLEVRLERRAGRANYRAILDHMNAGKRPADARQGRRFVIDRVRVREVTAHVQLLPPGGRATELELRIPEIRLSGVGERSGGVLASELTAILVQAVLEALARKGVGLPAQLASDLRAQLDAFVRLPIRLPEEAVRRGGEAAGEVLEGAGRVLRGLGDRVRGER